MRSLPQLPGNLPGRLLVQLAHLPRPYRGQVTSGKFGKCHPGAQLAARGSATGSATGSARAIPESRRPAPFDFGCDFRFSCFDTRVSGPTNPRGLRAEHRKPLADAERWHAQCGLAALARKSSKHDVSSLFLDADEGAAPSVASKQLRPAPHQPREQPEHRPAGWQEPAAVRRRPSRRTRRTTRALGTALGQAGVSRASTGAPTRFQR